MARLLLTSASSVLMICLLVFFAKDGSAADFAVSTRNDVLELTSKIQATQFLTHATFGATQAEIDQLALEMRQNGTITAATAWIDKQMNASLVPVSRHLPKSEAMVTEDFQFWSIVPGPASLATVLQPQATLFRTPELLRRLRAECLWVVSRNFRQGYVSCRDGGLAKLSRQPTSPKWIFSR